MDKKQLTISVIIPVYNVEKYLVDCLESVVNQTVPFEQIIVINDGSTDNSLSICERYQNNYDNIFLYSQKNQGLAAARNKGMEYVTSKYLIFLDSDDYLAINTVEILHKNLEKSNLDILYFDADIINELDDIEKKNNYDRTSTVISEEISGKEYFSKYYSKGLFVLSACMACFRQKFLKENRISFPVIRAHEDRSFSLQAALEADRVMYIAERLYVRRYRPGSILTNEKNEERWYGFVNSCQLRCSYIIDTINNYTIEQIISLYKCVSNDYGMMNDKLRELEHNSQNEKKLMEYQKNFSESREIILAKYKVLLKEKLENLPLGVTGKKVGIYGTGYHTDQLLAWYQYLCGKIESTLYFLDTYKKTGVEEYQGRPLINVADAQDYIDYVIISSSKYEAEMKKKLEVLFENAFPVFCFYENNNKELFINFEKYIMESECI